jgi:hypothetical protein
MRRYWESHALDERSRLKLQLAKAGYSDYGPGVLSLINYANHELDKLGKLELREREWWPGKRGPDDALGGPPGRRR